ncbi:PDR/VanB family oxidoreductase [Streptomyces alkaliterrae]|uniref:2Fe-2S iron-sulfur cluster binding domain-containing protein n=1 Tax=Streptomyces alkaliterrae TaxID=2213162 RepID=A0A5P0YUJ4_9ACTN|nr:PDR/VanB family oxidoreductase [Streptomyces alkaliterrae]MBB1252218.1 oxidoreductase [Streptomyces alkaliterrae]MBB1260412.1 oxidoreductase [Streptomyces alkaliterrae]MQS02149.1 2Fe-2S iron-sulfur cluster binding domain-containing protein [Streptomyces alkaliterrae]
MRRLLTVAAAAGAAILVKRALGRRVERSPLWPMPALPEPVSGVERERPQGFALQVAERTTPAEDVVMLRLTGDRGALPDWEPGAHIDVVLPSGLVRQYSLCGDPAEADTYTIATRLVPDGRGGSREVHEQLYEATEVEVRGPRNRFPLVDAPAYLFVAGGIGITPLLPMVRAVAAAGLPWRLVYGGRSRATMPFLPELAALAEQSGGAADERLLVVPEDEAGLPDVAAALTGAPREAAVYCCGPDPLMDAVSELCAERAPGGGLHLERFSPGPATRPGATGDTSFEVELRRTGRTVKVDADTTVLAAIRAQALPNLPYSCEQGFCGTCQQTVVAGEIDHRDELLTDGERGDSMLICVSRSQGGNLVLDL